MHLLVGVQNITVTFRVSSVLRKLIGIRGNLVENHTRFEVLKAV